MLRVLYVLCVLHPAPGDVSRVRETISGVPSGPETPRMRSYSELFRTREFTPLFLSACLALLGFRRWRRKQATRA